MRIFGYILLAGGLVVLGFGLVKYYTAMTEVEELESRIPAARTAFDQSKNTNNEKSARAELEALRTRIYELKPEAAKKQKNSFFWTYGGIGTAVVALGFIIFGKPRRRMTQRRRSERLWA